MSFKTLNYETADQFVEALSPTGALLGRAPIGQLIFRGHANAEWSLLPSVFRATVAASNAVQVRAEAVVLREFLELADRQGLPIPGDGDDLRRELDRAADDDQFLRRMT
jgi:hypothetical protein